MVIILDSLHRFSFQFIKNDSAAIWIDCVVYKEQYTTEIERLFLAANSFNTNLVKCLPPHYVIISNVHICSFMCMISHVHRCVQNLVYEKILINEGMMWFLFLKLQTIVQLYILWYYCNVRIGFNMNNKRHTLPIVYTMLV